jgi:hypothetical protein
MRWRIEFNNMGYDRILVCDANSKEDAYNKLYSQFPDALPKKVEPYNK